MRKQYSSTKLLIGYIAVETASVLIARQAAEIVNAIPTSERPAIGVVLVDGIPIKWSLVGRPLIATKACEL